SNGTGSEWIRTATTNRRMRPRQIQGHQARPAGIRPEGRPAPGFRGVEASLPVLCRFFFRPIAWLVKATGAKKKVENESRWAGTDSGMRIVLGLRSLFVAAMDAAAILARGPVPVAVLSLGKERAATLKRSGSDPGFAWSAQEA